MINADRRNKPFLTAKDTLGFDFKPAGKRYPSIHAVTRHKPGDLEGKQSVAISPVKAEMCGDYSLDSF